MKNRKKIKNKATPFFKIEATGNDFIFIDQRSKGNKKISRSQRAHFAKKACDRHLGAGADGVVFLEKPSRKTAEIKWDFYNSDGSSAEMCGNAVRAVGLLIFDFEKRIGPVLLETKAGIVEIRKAATGLYGATLPKVKILSGPKVQSVSGKSIIYFMVNSGVPHAVVPLKKKLKLEELFEIAVGLKKSKRLGKRGANVTFFWKTQSGIGAITHERGVENFTLSCGTGALAAAWVSEYVLEMKSSGRVLLPGGQIKISFGESPELVGPAVLVAQGVLYV